MQDLNQNKMTAVEWLVEQLAKNGVLHSLDIAKAKEMEREQRKKVWQESRKIKSQCNNWNCTGDEKLHESFEQYYNETFKSE